MRDLIFGIGVVALLFVVFGAIARQENKQPCSFYADVPITSIPARCVNYYLKDSKLSIRI